LYRDAIGLYTNELVIALFPTFLQPLANNRSFALPMVVTLKFSVGIASRVY